MDWKKIAAALRKLSATELDWWNDAYREVQQDLPITQTIDRIAADDELDPLDLAGEEDFPVWHLALIAKAAGATVKVPAPKTLGGTKDTVVEGSLHVKGPLKVKGVLVVTGDLIIDGPLIDSAEQWHRIVVGGNLQAHAIASSQDIVVCGNCTIRDIVWGFEQHCPFVVRGTLTTPLYVLADHRPSKVGSEKVKKKLENATQDALEATFDKKLLGDCEIKLKALLTRIEGGKSFAPEPAKKKARA